MCDHFAASMLIIPEKLISILGNKRTKIVMQELYLIAEQYGISLSAIAYHAYSLGIIMSSLLEHFLCRNTGTKNQG